MKMLKRCLAYLKRNGIVYSHSTHMPAYTAREVASAERMPAHRLMKTVVYAGDNGYGMLVLPANYIVNFLEVRRLLGLTEIRLAPEPEQVALFPDCEVGAMPPFGTLFNMPVLVDENIAAAEFMAFSAGTHRDVIRMSGADFHALVNPLVASFAVKDPTEVPAQPASNHWPSAARCVRVTVSRLCFFSLYRNASRPMRRMRAAWD
jgi:Ala-tRNA(Pro) deacylase